MFDDVMQIHTLLALALKWKAGAANAVDWLIKSAKKFLSANCFTVLWQGEKL